MHASGTEFVLASEQQPVQRCLLCIGRGTSQVRQTAQEERMRHRTVLAGVSHDSRWPRQGVPLPKLAPTTRSDSGLFAVSGAIGSRERDPRVIGFCRILAQPRAPCSGRRVWTGALDSSTRPRPRDNHSVITTYNRAAGLSGAATRSDSTLLDATACRGTTYRSSEACMLRWQSDLRFGTAERAGWQLHMQVCKRQHHRTGIDPTKSPHRGQRISRTFETQMIHCFRHNRANLPDAR